MGWSTVGVLLCVAAFVDASCSYVSPKGYTYDLAAIAAQGAIPFRLFGTYEGISSATNDYQDFLFKFCDQLNTADITHADPSDFSVAGCQGHYACQGSQQSQQSLGLGTTQSFSPLPDYAGGDQGQGLVITNKHGAYGVRNSTSGQQANATIYLFCDPMREDFTEKWPYPGGNQYNYTYMLFNAVRADQVTTTRFDFNQFAYGSTAAGPHQDEQIFVGASPYACSRRLNALTTRYLPNVVGWNDQVGFSVSVSNINDPAGQYLTGDDSDVVQLWACYSTGISFVDNPPSSAQEVSSLRGGPLGFVEDQSYPDTNHGCFLMGNNDLGSWNVTTEDGIADIYMEFGAHRLAWVGAVIPVDPMHRNGLFGQVVLDGPVAFDGYLGTPQLGPIRGLYRSTVLFTYNRAVSASLEGPISYGSPSQSVTYTPTNILSNCHAPPLVTNGYWDCTNGQLDGGVLTGNPAIYPTIVNGPLYTVVTNMEDLIFWDISDGFPPGTSNPQFELAPVRPKLNSSSAAIEVDADVIYTGTTCTLKCNHGFVLSPSVNAIFNTSCTFTVFGSQYPYWDPLPGPSGPACVPDLVQHTVGSPCAGFSTPQVCPAGYVSMQDILKIDTEQNIGHYQRLITAQTDPFCYKIYPPFTAETYVEAQGRCLNDGGMLAVVTNPDQNVAISLLANSATGYTEGTIANDFAGGYVNVFPYGVNGAPVLLRGQWSPNTYAWQWYTPALDNTPQVFQVVPPLPTSAAQTGYQNWITTPNVPHSRTRPLCMGIEPCHDEVETCNRDFYGNGTSWAPIEDCDRVWMSAIACMTLRVQPVANYAFLRNIYLGRITSPSTFLPTFNHVSDYRQFSVTWDQALYGGATPLPGENHGRYEVLISSQATPNAWLGANQPVFNNGDVAYLGYPLLPLGAGTNQDVNGNPAFITIDLNDPTVFENFIYQSVAASMQDNTEYQIIIRDHTTGLFGYTCFNAGWSQPDSTQFCSSNYKVTNPANILQPNALTLTWDPTTTELTWTVKLPFLQQGWIWQIDFKPWDFDLTNTNPCAVLSALPGAVEYGSGDVNENLDLFSVAPSAYWLMNAYTAYPSAASNWYYDYPLGYFYSKSQWKVSAPPTASATNGNCSWLTFQWTDTPVDMLANCNMLINPRIDSGRTVQYSGTVYVTAIATADAQAQPEPGTEHLCASTRSCYSAFTYAINYAVNLQGLNSVISTEPIAIQIASDAGLTFQLLSVTPQGTPVTTVQGNFITQVIVVVRVITGQLDDSLPASADTPPGSDVYVNGQPVLGTTVTQGAFVPSLIPGYYQRDYQYTIANAPLVATYDFHYRRRGCSAGHAGCASITPPLGTGISIPVGDPDYVYAGYVNLAQIAPTLAIQSPLTLTITGATGLNSVTGQAFFQGGDTITFDVQASSLLGVQLVLQNAWICTTPQGANEVVPTTANGGCENPNNGDPTGPVTQVLYIPIAQYTNNLPCNPVGGATTCAQNLPHIFYVLNNNQDVVSNFAVHQYLSFASGVQDYRKQIQLSAAPLQSTNQLYFVQIEALSTALSSNKRSVKMVLSLDELRDLSKQQDTLGSFSAQGNGALNAGANNNNGGTSTVTTSSNSSSSSATSGSMLWAWLAPVLVAVLAAAIIAAALITYRRRQRAQNDKKLASYDENDSERGTATSSLLTSKSSVQSSSSVPSSSSVQSSVPSSSSVKSLTTSSLASSTLASSTKTSQISSVSSLSSPISSVEYQNTESISESDAPRRR